MKKLVCFTVLTAIFTSCKTVPLKDREHLSSRIMKWGAPKMVASIHGSDLERNSMDSNTGSSSCVSCAE